MLSTSEKEKLVNQLAKHVPLSVALECVKCQDANENRERQNYYVFVASRN